MRRGEATIGVSGMKGSEEEAAATADDLRGARMVPSAVVVERTAGTGT